MRRKLWKSCLVGMASVVMINQTVPPINAIASVPEESGAQIEDGDFSEFGQNEDVNENYEEESEGGESEEESESGESEEESKSGESEEESESGESEEKSESGESEEEGESGESEEKSESGESEEKSESGESEEEGESGESEESIDLAGNEFMLMNNTLAAVSDELPVTLLAELPPAVGDVLYDDQHVGYKIKTLATGTAAGTVQITSSPEASGDIEIGSTVELNGQTYNVVFLDISAFRGNRKITSLVLSVQDYRAYGKQILGAAFEGCTGLQRVDLSGSNYTVVGPGTFEGCASLEEVIFPPKVSKLNASGLFKGCESLTSLELPSISSDLNGKDMLAGSGIQELTFKNGSFTVWGDVFANLTGDLTIFFKGGVPTFKDTAFGESSVNITIVVQDQYSDKKERLQTQFKAKNNIQIVTESEYAAKKTVEVSGLSKGDAQFPTLADAVKAINEDEGDGSYTITLLEDADLTKYDDFMLPEKECTITAQNGAVLKLGHNENPLVLKANTTFTNITIKKLSADVNGWIFANGYQLVFGAGVKAEKDIVIFGGVNPSLTAYKESVITQADVEILSGSPSVICRGISGDVSVLLNSAGAPSVRCDGVTGDVDIILKKKASGVFCANVDGKSTLVLDGFGTRYFPTEMTLEGEGVDETQLTNSATLKLSGDATKWGDIVLGLNQQPYTAGILYLVGDTTVKSVKSNTIRKDVVSEIVYTGAEVPSLTVNGEVSGNLLLKYSNGAEGPKSGILVAEDTAQAKLTLAGAGEDYELVQNGNSWSVDAKKTVISEANTQISQTEISAEYGKSLAELLPTAEVICTDDGQTVKGSWSWKLEEGKEASEIFPGSGSGTNVYTAVFTPSPETGYRGNAEFQFTVAVQAVDLGGERFSFRFDTLKLVYDGTVRLPKLSAAEDTLWPEGNENRVLKEQQDFVVTYADASSEPGIYTIRIEGIGNYRGTRSVTYEIVKAKEEAPADVPEGNQGTSSGNTRSSSGERRQASLRARTDGSWKQEVDGTWSYLTAGQNKVTGWQYIQWSGGSSWFSFNEAGQMETGWKLSGDSYWYYLDPATGAMRTGWVLIDGKWYYFSPSAGQVPWGAMYRLTRTPDGYMVGADGAWDGMPSGQ